MKILILGGTGAMGVHVSDLLSQKGHDVVVTSRRECKSSVPNLQYRQGDAKDPAFLRELLSERWDAIVDFMVWSTAEFADRVEQCLNATGQYVFVSSYRVYADSPVIAEDSPRLLDVVDDSDYLKTDEYALAKARCENMLFESGKKNWTIVRPAVTYDGTGRFQLAVHESEVWLRRALNDIPVPLPDVICGKQGTMTWGGDVARMIALLSGNPQALGEAFTVSTSEQQTWREISGIYKSVVSTLKVVDCDMAKFERAHGAMYQIRYDRMYDRIIDNSKVLAVTGLNQSDLSGLQEGITRELNGYLARNREKALRMGSDFGRNARFDKLVGGIPSFSSVAKNGMVPICKYLIRRFL